MFELLDERKISFFYDEVVAEKIKNREKIRGPLLKGEDLCFYKLTDLKKTEEFGGEYHMYAEEQKQIEALKDELFNLKQTQTTNSIPLKIGNTIFNVSSVEKTPGVVKSDFHFVTEDNTPVIWISHKKGSNSRHFQQWGGLSKFAFHDEVKKFVKDIKELYPDGVDPTTTIIREIEDETLMIKSIYGEGFGSETNENNVTLVIHGDMSFVSNQEYYEIKAEHIRYNGNLPAQEFQPVFTASYRKMRNDFGIPNTRITVSPAGGRTGVTI